MVVPPAGSLTRTPPFLHRVPAGRFPCFVGTTRCSDSSPCIPLHFVAFARRYHLHSVIRSHSSRVLLGRAWTLVARRPPGIS